MSNDAGVDGLDSTHSAPARPFDSRRAATIRMDTGLELDLGMDTWGTASVLDEPWYQESPSSLGLLRGSAETVKMVDASIRWRAMDGGDVRRDGASAWSISLISGVRGFGVGGPNEPAQLLGFSGAAYDTLAVLGSEVRWRLDEDVELRGIAAGHAGDSDRSLLDVTAELAIRLGRGAHVLAGYRLFDAELAEARAKVEDSGFFAGLRIRF